MNSVLPSILIMIAWFFCSSCKFAESLGLLLEVPFWLLQ